VLNAIESAYKDYGSILSVFSSFLPFFVVLEPEYLQQILGSKKNLEKGFIYKFLHNFLGKGLLTNSGKTWQSHRRYLQPLFAMNILKEYIETFAESSQCLHSKLMNAPEVIDVTKLVNETVMDILNGKVDDFNHSF